MQTIANFSIQYHQYLDSDGNVVQKPPVFAEDPALMLKLYRVMLLLRTFDTKAVALQRTGKIGTYAGILGQEAISVGIGHAMHKDDVFCPAYREYGALIQRGMKLSDILMFWGGDERGSAFNNPHDFPFCVPIATQCLHAAGVATAFKLRKQPRVAVAVIGDGGTSEGDFYEAINVAGDWKLPMVLVINNNQWAISVPRSIQTGAETLAQKAIAAGVHSLQVDGNDLIAVREHVGAAIEKARKGEGPTLIEAMTYRLCDHTTADDASRYRCAEEVAEARTKEPLARLQQYLLTTKMLSPELQQQLQTECSQEVEAAVQHYFQQTPPDPLTMFDFHFEKITPDLAEQRQAFVEMLSWQK